MTEAVGLASATLSLTIFTLNTSKSLYEAISSFKSQRKTVKDLQTDICSLVTVLESIRAKAQIPQEAERLEPLQSPLECCLATCQDIRNMVDACTKHSATGRDSVRDWLNMRYHEKSIEDMKQRLASYKSTLSITFGSINMLDHLSTQDSLDNLRDSIRGTKEDLEDQLDKLQEMMGTKDESRQGRLHADQTQLQRSLESLEQAQKITDISHPDVIVRNNRSNDRSRAVFGTDTSQPSFSLDVSNNEVGLGAVAAAGVHTPQTLQVLLGSSRTPDIAFELEKTFQEAQIQSQGTYNHALKSIRHSLSVGPSEVSQRESPGISEDTKPGGFIDSPTPSVDLRHTEDLLGEQPVDRERIPRQVTGKE